MEFEKFEQALGKIHHEANALEIEAMGLYGAKETTFDNHCPFDDFFKIYADHKVNELEAKLKVAVESLERVKEMNDEVDRPEIDQYINTMLGRIKAK